ncbi:MAG: hypothetical protein A3A04_01665 [Candidatus Harrisonbacteria bacterium RIFCSPLOWO2_01_FULL_40_28]|uniref:Single-stranded DNA-binding protein n=2 Tax=Candidatus Harrisoniibacteriota TaxID=1817905 RepID=A0A1G1ZWX5_9BACT|nr:MAG: hypothetical protein A3A04_01665 [Candidatus Harrisonbacteria bacterium RIFCSPLOWO2_01_FULL_40_28]OGY68676.1 MAG: hypothetical protein A2586_00610 [Candidatus Harrisonbacteria bacterium RIFOXYD1_FULL_40_9]
MNLNKVFILGRLTVDPQLRTTPTGQAVATLGLATNRVWMDKNNNKQEQVEFHNVIVWGRQAEIVKQFLAKGSLLLVEGRLQTRSWVDKQGQNRKTTEIVADKVQFGPRTSGGADRVQPFNAGEDQSKDSNAMQGGNVPQVATIDISEESEEIKPEDIGF